LYPADGAGAAFGCCVLSCRGMQPAKASEHAAMAAHDENVPILSLLRRRIASTTAGTIVNLGGGRRPAPGPTDGPSKVARASRTEAYRRPMGIAQRGAKHERASCALGTLAALGVCAATATGCTRGEPPAPPGSPSVALPDLPLPGLVASSPPGAVPLPPATGGAMGPTAPPGSAASSTPRGQTHDRPSASGAAFEARRDALWDAIVNDDPERAMPFFFPLEAYEQVKDVGDPGGDWRRRLVAAYKKDLHALHAQLGGDAGAARLVSLAVPDGRATWVEPGEEWNKVGYYRVYGSKLRFTTPDGAAGAFDVKSLIAWRGEWFVVHLSAIK
jgi:hypothetical protein